VRQITFAPEIEGANELIAAACAAGVVPSIGHTDARQRQVFMAAKFGATQATHTFNAMRPLSHREPGTVGGVLTTPEIHAEVIADGVHLNPVIVDLIIRAKGIDRTILITDAMEGAAMPDATYSLGGVKVIVKDGVAELEDGTLAGSVLTMNRAFQNAQKFAHVDAQAASQMSSLNAARQIGVDGRLGSLEPGKDADIVILDPATGEVHWTIIGGQVAYRR